MADAAEHAEFMEWLAGEIKPSDFAQVLVDAGGEAADVSNGGEAGADNARAADKAAEVPAEQAVAMMCVAVCYLHGIGVEADKDAACDWMAKAGNSGCGAAAYWYGELLMRCEDDCLRIDSAMSWFDAAHRYEYADGERRSLECELLSLFFERMDEDSDFDDSDSDYAYKYDSDGNIVYDENGEPIKRMLIPGDDDYREGRIVLDLFDDKEMAMMCFLKAASVKHIDAARDLAILYRNDIGHGEYKKLSLAILMELAPQYDPLSMYYYAETLRIDCGTPSDLDAAEIWY